MIDRRCFCGLPLSDATYRGAQELGGGDYALLVNCACGATHTESVVRDASVCRSCGHLILGDAEAEDVKICVGYPDGTIGIFCVDCAPHLVGVGRGVDGGRAERAKVAAAWPRRITIGEVMAQGGDP